MFHGAKQLVRWMAAILLGALGAVPSVSLASDDWQRAATLFAGTMTAGTWHEALSPPDVEFADSHLIGGVLSWDRPIGASAWRFGAELQLMGHFGRQGHFEIVLPLVLRYEPRRARNIKSVGAGIGLSHATKVPQVEVDRSGASQRNFVYWMADLEFSRADPDDSSVLIRLHHRSDGYGLFEVNSGSTGLLVGLRQQF